MPIALIMKTGITLSIIIATLNEEEGIAKVICSIPGEIRNISEVIVVDVSSDLTPVIARRLGVKVIQEPKKGKGWQMRQGVKESKGEILVFLDGDGTDPAGYIPKLLEKLEEADIVLGSRSLEKFDEDDPNMRKVFKLYNMVARPMTLLFGLKVDDPLAGFRAIRRKDWDKLNLKSAGFDIETEMNIKAIRQHFVIKQVRIPNLKRCGGARGSKFLKSPKMWFKIFKMILRYRHHIR